jgi:hypothetical protein
MAVGGGVVAGLICCWLSFAGLGILEFWDKLMAEGRSRSRRYEGKFCESTIHDSYLPRGIIGAIVEIQNVDYGRHILTN